MWALARSGVMGFMSDLLAGAEHVALSEDAVRVEAVLQLLQSGGVLGTSWSTASAGTAASARRSCQAGVGSVGSMWIESVSVDGMSRTVSTIGVATARSGATSFSPLQASPM